MLHTLARKVFGTKNDREIKRLSEVVSRVNSLESGLKNLSDENLKSQFTGYKNQADQGRPLVELMPEVFALVREVSRRHMEMRHFDVQIIGGAALHEGHIAEMKTGEGKTLTATLPLVLNALSKQGAHLVTVNDYLAHRDAEWMGKIYNFLGLSVGIIVHDLSDRQRQAAYGSDITYGTNNEFGFDYLRDNMKFRIEDMVQRNLNFCIVDEVDSILVDEARTPLIISGPSDASSDLYYKVNAIIPHLKKEEHYTIEEKAKTAMLTDAGVEKVQELLKLGNLYDPSNIAVVHHVLAALKAHVIFKIDVDYVVRQGEVIIVDEFTGRLMTGRRWSDGLHQAVEAKEGVTIEAENQTLATITFQNFFRMYKKLAGMTGTADTEAEEFKRIYNLDVIVIPTNVPMIRNDQADLVYKTEPAKFKAAIDEIEEKNKKGQPVLVGTISIEKSEHLSELLKRRGIKHNVLNAKQHEREAEIVAQAGQKDSVTISTNMAGRGTDIKLGPGVRELGGLHILGTERHESRRIDNQLRGRSGRQGDPGSSRFYVSLEDDLMRIFGGERLKTWMDRFGMKDDEAIEHKYVSKSIENAQKKVEGHNFDIRKHLLEYDDVMNQQRTVIYKRRKEILGSKSIEPTVKDICLDLVDSIAAEFDEARQEDKNANPKVLAEGFQSIFDLAFTPKEMTEISNFPVEAPGLVDYLSDLVSKKYQLKEQEIGSEVFHNIERVLYLQSIDHYWKEHLLSMDHLKEGIGLRGYGQKDPLVEYKKEAFNLFVMMDSVIKNNFISKLFKMRVRMEEAEALPQKAPEGIEVHAPAPTLNPSRAEQELRRLEEKMQKAQDRIQLHAGSNQGPAKPQVNREERVGRNDPCPCGSGKKYKKCHGRA